jgi:hypothetical protein
MKFEYLTIINNDSSPITYNGLVNRIANIQEFKECYIQLSKFQCEATQKNIVISLQENLCGYVNNNNVIMNSRILDTSFPITSYTDVATLKFVHNINNHSDRWIKIHDFNNINNLNLVFETVNFANMTKTAVNDLKFIAHFTVKLV